MKIQVNDQTKEVLVSALRTGELDANDIPELRKLLSDYREAQVSLHNMSVAIQTTPGVYGRIINKFR